MLESKKLDDEIVEPIFDPIVDQAPVGEDEFSGFSAKKSKKDRKRAKKLASEMESGSVTPPTLLEEPEVTQATLVEEPISTEPDNADQSRSLDIVDSSIEDKPLEDGFPGSSGNDNRKLGSTGLDSEPVSATPLLMEESTAVELPSAETSSSPNEIVEPKAEDEARRPDVSTSLDTDGPTPEDEFPEYPVKKSKKGKKSGSKSASGAATPAAADDSPVGALLSAAALASRCSRWRGRCRHRSKIFK